MVDQYIFLLLRRPLSSGLPILFEGLVFIAVGFLTLFFSRTQSSDYIFYAMLFLGFFMFIVGLHILLAFATYMVSGRRYRGG